MSKAINPFKPTAGMNPPELIGRDAVLDDFAEALENGPGAPDRLMRISGVRGTGKTVLLNALGDLARKKGFEVVDVASNAGFCSRILEALQRNVRLESMSISPSILGVSLGSVEVSKSASHLGEAMYDAAKRGGLLITLDEIQDASTEEMRELGNEMQLLIRQGANVAFAFAGLPTSVDGVVVDDTLTFLQRAKHIELTRLSDFEVGGSFEETMRRAGKELDEGVAELLTKASAGYPFMVQLVGYYAWQVAARSGSESVSEEAARKGVQAALDSFNAMVIAPALRRVSERQFQYLAAMAQCEGGEITNGDIAKKMGLPANKVGSYRKRLIDTGLIEPAGYGCVSFAIPYMRDYLLETVRAD